MGAIILAADTLFARELLEGYENAYFFSYDNVDQLSQLMKKVIKGEIARKAINESEAEEESSWLPRWKRGKRFYLRPGILGSFFDRCEII